MSRQILLCVESNNKARTDYQYIESTIKRFYIDDRKIRYRAIYLGSKTKYNAKDKVREINNNIKNFPGDTTIIYFIDVDDYDIYIFDGQRVDQVTSIFSNIFRKYGFAINSEKTEIEEYPFYVISNLQKQKNNILVNKDLQEKNKNTINLVFL